MGISREKLLWLYERMRLIREFEERLPAEAAKGKPVSLGGGHSYVGQEAVAVGFCAHLKDDDFVGSTHRPHGHCLAKGVDVKAAMAELFGKATGTNRGKGGSMHLADLSMGFIGGNGIVAASAPHTVGAGLTAKVKGTDQVGISFWGDGGANQGVLHEALNMAAIWKLPVVFVCENNRYGITTPVEYSTSVSDIADRAAGYGMPGVVVDGQDIFAVYEAAGEAIARARRGEGPSFIEAKTYRYYDHAGRGDTGRYRPKEEEEYYRGRDCIGRFVERAVGEGLLTQAELDEVDARIQAQMDEAVAFAEASPSPEVHELYTDVFAG